MSTNVEKFKERCGREGIKSINVSLDVGDEFPVSREEVLGEIMNIMDSPSVPDPDLL
ncbi:MAG: hypothetical protein WC375_09555 [Methanomassiliicoccales archaeon]|jgi:hypothetical protein